MAALWAEDAHQPGTAAHAHPTTQAAAVAAAASTPSHPALVPQPGAPQQAVAHPPGPPTATLHPPLQPTPEDTTHPPPEATTQRLHPAHTQLHLHQALQAQLPHHAGPKTRRLPELSTRLHQVPEAAAAVWVSVVVDDYHMTHPHQQWLPRPVLWGMIIRHIWMTQSSLFIWSLMQETLFCIFIFIFVTYLVT